MEQKDMDRLQEAISIIFEVEQKWRKDKYDYAADTLYKSRIEINNARSRGQKTKEEQNRSKTMAKKYIKSEEPCPSCGSESGPCNMCNPKIIEPRQIAIAGHCADCGYSFTRIFSLTLDETMERN